MTHEEQIAKLTEMLEIQQKLHETAIDMIKPAIEAEREACARVCELMWHKWLDSPEENEPNKPDAEDCYRAIRARGQA
jgi:hypothetical protein